MSLVYVTAPITFVAAGAVISAVTPATTADVTEFVKVLAEVTLALILFHDAAQVRPRQIEADRGLILRLLLVGLPLTVLVGIWAAGGALPAVIVMLLAARWLLVQLRTDRLGRISLHSDTDPGAGRSDLPAAALSASIDQEIHTYPGVQAVKVQIAGRPDQPELRVDVTVDPDADLTRLRTRITDEAIAHARTALDTPKLPTQLRLAVGRRARTKNTYI